MITLGGGATKIHLATEPIDLRRGYSGLYTLVEQQFGAEPQSGNLWVFTNRRRNLLKIFWWDEGGMVVLGKPAPRGYLPELAAAGAKDGAADCRRTAAADQRTGSGKTAAPPLGAPGCAGVGG
jgi:transposase